MPAKTEANTEAAEDDVMIRRCYTRGHVESGAKAPTTASAFEDGSAEFND